MQARLEAQSVTCVFIFVIYGHQTWHFICCVRVERRVLMVDWERKGGERIMSLGCSNALGLEKLCCWINGTIVDFLIFFILFMCINTTIDLKISSQFSVVLTISPISESYFFAYKKL